MQNEVSKWTRDHILCHTEIPLWITSYMKFVYILAMLSGSSFSAIKLVNSNLLELQIFSMNLSKYHQQLFETQRFFSIVLFENLPQLIITIITLNLILHEDPENTDGATLLITVFSMIFTIFSIFSCVLEFCTTRQVMNSNDVAFVRIFVQSSTIGRMKSREFRNKIVHAKKSVIHSLKRALQVGASQLDLLQPKQDAKGVLLMFLIQINQADNDEYNEMKHRLTTAIKDKVIANVCIVPYFYMFMDVDEVDISLEIVLFQ